MTARVMGQDQGTLSAAAAMVAAARQDLDRLDRELGTHLDTAGARWLGEGLSAFVALGAAWRQRQRVIVGALDGFEAALRATERDNLATDAAQAADFARHQQRLG